MNGDLVEMARRAKEAYDRLTPEQKKAHDREQRISWVYGNLALSTNHKVSRRQIELIVDAEERGE